MISENQYLSNEIPLQTSRLFSIFYTHKTKDIHTKHQLTFLICNKSYNANQFSLKYYPINKRQNVLKINIRRRIHEKE